MIIEVMNSGSVVVRHDISRDDHVLISEHKIEYLIGLTLIWVEPNTVVLGQMTLANFAAFLDRLDKQMRSREVCSRCGVKKGSGTIRVLGCGGDYEDWPCDACRPEEYRRVARGL